jgi:hypothetical protein
MNDIVTIEIITERIFEIRLHKVMVDSDLAALYEVPKHLRFSIIQYFMSTIFI